MERKEDENEETTSEEEEEVPGASACSQHNENSGITGATRCSYSSENQGILRNDDSGRDESFLSPRSQIRDYAKPLSCSTPLVARDGDSSAVCNMEGPLRNKLKSPQSDPFLCNLRMTLSYDENTLSTIESPTREPGSVSSHLFEPASFQLLPEAQLNLSLDNNIPPNYTNDSTAGEIASSDPSSQLLPQTHDSNSSVISDDQLRRRRSTSFIASGVACHSDISSQLLPQTQDSNSLVVSGDQSGRHHSTSSIPSAVRCCSNTSSQLLPQTQDGNSLVISEDQSRHRVPTSSAASAARCLIDPPPQLLTQTQDSNSLMVSDNQLTPRSPASSIPTAVRWLINISPQFLAQTQGSNSLLVLDDQSRRRSPTSSIPSGVIWLTDLSPQFLPQTQDSNSLVTSHDLLMHRRPTSPINSTVKWLIDPSQQLLPETQDSNSLLVSDDQARRRRSENFITSSDSSALSNIDETFGTGMLSSERDPFLCNSGMSVSHNENISSIIESPAREPGFLSSHLFEPASLQLLPEALLNLSLDNNIPPNYTNGSSPGENTSSDPSSQLLPQKEDNSLVVSVDQSRQRRSKSSITRANSSAVSNIDEPLGIGMSSSESDPFLRNSGMSISYNEGTLSIIESPASEPGLLSSHLFEPASLELLPEAQLNLSLDNNNSPNYSDGLSPGESTSSDPFSQLLTKRQDSNSLVVSGDQSRRRRSRSSLRGAVRNPCDIRGCRLINNTAHSIYSHIRWDQSQGAYVCRWSDCSISSPIKNVIQRHLYTHSVTNS